MEGEKWESIKGNTKLDKAAEFLTHSYNDLADEVSKKFRK